MFRDSCTNTIEALSFSILGLSRFVYDSAMPFAAKSSFCIVRGNFDRGGEGIEGPTEGFESGVAVLGRGMGSGEGEGFDLEVSSLVRLFCFFKGFAAIFMLPKDLGDRS